MIPRRTITFYPGMAGEIVRSLLGSEPEDPVRRFEENFARYVGVDHAVATCSGTDAMLLILDALGLKAGDHILTTVYTIKPLIETLVAKGFVIELLDISTEDFNISLEDLKSKIRPDTKVVIVTHMFGTPARMEEIEDLLAESGAFLVEDAAHAHGAEYKGRKCGSFGKAAFFSLDQVKPVSTFSGGMITTNEETIAAATRAVLGKETSPGRRIGKVVSGYLEHFLVNSPIFGAAAWLSSNEKLRELLGNLYRLADRRKPGRNLRLSPLQALIGLSQLDYLETRLSKRRKNASYLTTRLPNIRPQRTPFGALSAYHKFAAMIDGDPRDLKKRLLGKGIDIGIGNDINFPCHRLLGGSDADFPGVVRVFEHLVELPAYDTLSTKELDRIASAVSKFG